MRFAGAALSILLGIVVVQGLVACDATPPTSRREVSFEPIEEISSRFPKASTNPSAATLVELAAKLGIALGPSGWPRLPEEQRKRFQEVQAELRSFVQDQAQKPNDELDAPPATVAAYLAAHNDALNTLQRHVVQAEAPSWAADLTQGPDAPIPNLVGHWHMQDVLALAFLDATRRGRLHDAAEFLEVSWKINLGLRDRPELISQLSAARVATLQAGIMRKGVARPAGWQDRLMEHDYRSSVLIAIQADRWALSEHIRALPPTGNMYARRAADDVYLTVRRAMQDLWQNAPCAPFDPAAFGRKHAVAEWNTPGQIAVPDYGKAWQQVDRLAVDLELTRKVLAVNKLQSASRDRSWPHAVPGIEFSICPGARWTYQVLPDGSMSLALSKDLPAPSWALPLHYIVRQKRS